MRIVRLGTVAAAVLAAGSAFAWEGPKRTVDPAAAPVRRTWADVKASIAASIDRTAYGYFAYSHAFNDIGPIDTSGTLTDEELRTQFAMACVLASPITVKGPAPAAVARWLADGMLMNINDDKVARQGHVVQEKDGAFVLLKYLWGMNGAHNAIVFYNPTDAAKRMSVTPEALSLSGSVTWVDRFDSAKAGKFDREFCLEVPAHGVRLFYVSGTPGLRNEYRRECAFRSPGMLIWRDVYVPRDGQYALRVVTKGNRMPKVVVNGRPVAAGAVNVSLFTPENLIVLKGEGVDDVSAIQIGFAKAVCANISVFATAIGRYAAAREISISEASKCFYDAGVRGFDAEYTNENLPVLNKGPLRPVSLYGWVDFAKADGGRAQSDNFVLQAVKYGVPRIMVIPNDFTDGGNKDAEFAVMVNGMRYLADKAEENGVVVMIEDYGGTDNPCSYSKYLKRFLDEIPELSYALDTGNLYYAGRGENILDMMRFANGRIAHIHLKDFKAGGGHQRETIGLGPIPNETIVRAMRKNGYDAWITLEDLVGNPMDDVRRQVAVVRYWYE